MRGPALANIERPPRAASIRHPFSRFAALLLPVLGAYCLFDRAAAYIHVPGTPLYMAEALLGIGVIAAAIRPTYAWVAIRDDPLLCALVGFFLWGIAHTLLNLREYGFTWVVHDSALWYYSLFAVLVAAAALASPDLPRRYLDRFSRFMPWLLAWLPLAVVLQAATHIHTRVPFSPISVLDHKDGDVSVVVFLCVATLWHLPDERRSDRSRRNLCLLGVGTALLAGTQNRGGLVAGSVALVALVYLAPSVGRPAVKGVVAVAVGAILVGMLMPNLGTRSSRSVSPSQLAANLESLAGINKSDQLQGTEQARQRQWSYVLKLESADRALLAGWGPGPNLGFGAVTASGDETLRVPHNSHVDVVARLGLVGLGLWLLMWGCWFWRLSRSRAWLSAADFHRRRRAVEVCIAATLAILVNAVFDPALEGAQVAVLLWTLFGLGAVLSNRRWSVQL
jgi:hypothetical protein